MWPWPLTTCMSLIFMVKFWSSCISGMGGPINIERKLVIHDHDRDLLVNKVRCEDLPDNDQDDFRYRCAVDSSSLTLHFKSCVKNCHIYWNWPWSQQLFLQWVIRYHPFQIHYWKSDNPDDVHIHEIPVEPGKLCSPLDGGSGGDTRKRRQTDSSANEAHILDLWPNSEISAGILAKNTGNKGELSAPFVFTTPEGGEWKGWSYCWKEGVVRIIQNVFILSYYLWFIGISYNAWFSHFVRIFDTCQI